MGCKPAFDRLMKKTEVVDGACWKWKGWINPTTGYGEITLDGKKRGAHIVAYLLHRGPIPERLVLDHLCRNRACVNPAHLEAVTQQVNCQRGMTGKAPGTTGERNKAKTHCPHGHEYAGDNLIVRGRRRHCRACRRIRSALAEANGRGAKRRAANLSARVK